MSRFWSDVLRRVYATIHAFFLAGVFITHQASFNSCNLVLHGDMLAGQYFSAVLRVRNVSAFFFFRSDAWRAAPRAGWFVVLNGVKMEKERNGRTDQNRLINFGRLDSPRECAGRAYCLKTLR